MRQFFKKILCSKPKNKLQKDPQTHLWNQEILNRLDELEKNRNNMLELLIKWHIQTELNLNGLLMTRYEALNRAKTTWFYLKRANLIDYDNLIASGVKELYEEIISA